MAAVLSMAVLLAAAFALDRWLGSDRLFSSGAGAETVPVRVGHTVYLGLGPVPKGSEPNAVRHVELRTARPLVTANSAAATVTMLTCRSGRSGLLGGGVVVDDIGQYCDRLVPFQPGAIDLGVTSAGLVIAVTPRRAGTVEVDGAQVTYRHGIRTGRQHIGTAAMTVNVP